MQKPSPEQRVLECVDRGLASLGESSRQAIYWHFERSFGLTREEILRDPQEFKRVLEEMFGIGARVLERLIVMEIRSEFKLPSKVESFEQAIKKAMEGNN